MTTVKLNIPYRSQWDPDAKDHFADCGPTSLAMILNARGDPITPDQVYKFIGERGASQYTSFTDLKTAAAARGLTMTRMNFVPNTCLADLKARIDNGKPFIALVNYAFWDPIVHNGFKGAHFCLVTGYDDENVYIHDPLFKGDRREQGRFCPWTHELFTDAWGGFAPGENPNYAVLIAETTVPHLANDDAGRAAPIAPPPAPAALDDSTRRRLRARAAFDQRPDPDLNDPATVQALLANLGHWGETWDTYTVARGDNLSKIATRFYGDRALWPVIVCFNDIAHPSLVEVGDIYLVPRPALTAATDAHVPLPNHGGPTP